MTYHSSSISSLGYIQAHLITFTPACGNNSLPGTVSFHTDTCLPQDTERPPLSVYELICLLQTGWS